MSYLFFPADRINGAAVTEINTHIQLMYATSISMQLVHQVLKFVKLPEIRAGYGIAILDTALIYEFGLSLG